jgi:hypothetical protein
MNPTEEQLEVLSERLFPLIKKQLHTEDELAILAKKLQPHNDDLDAQKVGRFVIGEALGVLRKALWAIGAGLLAAYAYVKGVGK